MAEIIKKLNLNKHPKDVVNNSLVDAINIMISKDGTTLQTECGIDIYNTINDFIKEGVDEYEIIHCCPCNKELLIFVNSNDSNVLDIFRYNEDKNEIKYITNIEYNKGTLLTTFTYNKNELILAIAEYNSIQNSPLKVINIGKFDDDINEIENPEIFNHSFHTICPEVKIPIVNTNIQKGNAYKGWYYIFIRYKISNNNYTQWFNTNETAYIDSFDYESIIKIYYTDLEDDNNIVTDDYNNNGKYNFIISDNKDIATNTFKCSLSFLDDKYKEYQLGFICISKSYTKCFITNDFNITNNTFVFSNISVSEYSILKMVKSYNNYYNVKTLDNYNNRLYISNYEELEDIKSDNLKNITLTIQEKIDIIKLNNTITTTLINEDITRSVNNIVQDKTNYVKFSSNVNSQYKYNYYSPVEFDKTEIESEEYDDGGIIVEEIITKQIYKLSYYYTQIIIQNGESYECKFIKDISNIRDVYIKIKNSNAIYSLLSNNTYIKLIEATSNIENTIINPEIYFIINTESINKNDIEEIIIKYINDNDEPIEISSPLLLNNVIFNYNPKDESEDIDKPNDGDVDNNIENINSYNANDKLKLNNIGILPDQYYNFYVHFINKYGEISKGYQIKYFNVIIEENSKYIKEYNLNNKLIYVDNTNDINNITKTTLNIKINKLPDNYIGYFISYEKLEKYNIYTAYTNTIKINNIYNNYIFNDRFNYDDTINANINLVKECNLVNLFQDNTDNVNVDEDYVVYINGVKNIPYVNNIFKLNVADSFGNLLKPSNIKINNLQINNKYIKLYNNNINDFYNNENKILIPCTHISYKVNIYINLNTKNGFITNQHALINKDYSEVYYDNAINAYRIRRYADGNSGSTYVLTTTPFNIKNWITYDDICHESIQINNFPVIKAFASFITENPYNTVYNYGQIVELKNTIDLFKQPQVSIYELYPKVYTHYNPNLYYENLFSKTIRRSNVIQDESDILNWRIFESEQYTNINENKGNIIKITGIGNLMLVHTEHSLFMFNDTNTIKATQSDIQLGNVDIWDIKYKELLSSKLGYAGIKHEKDAIVGSFGYIFYDTDGKSIYRYDNNKLEKIDDDINNFLNQYDNINVNFIDDINNDRLLICFNASDITGKYNKFSLSYNYKTNNFISTHDYYFKGYTTKNNTYLLNNNLIYKYIDNNNLDYYTNAYNNYNNNENDRISKISIITNLSYEDIKFLNSIKYKLRNINEPYNTTIEPINGTIENAGDIIRTFSEYCDTGYIDVTKCNNEELFVEKNNGNYNAFNDYKIPVFRLGNWHFNGTKDKFVEYLKGNINYNEMSDIYGNWFVVSFIFNRHKIVEIESIDYKISNDIIK